MRGPPAAIQPEARAARKTTPINPPIDVTLGIRKTMAAMPAAAPIPHPRKRSACFSTVSAAVPRETMIAGDQAGMDAWPVQQQIDDVAEHRRAGRLQRVMDVRRVGEGVRKEKARLGLRRRLRRGRQVRVARQKPTAQRAIPRARSSPSAPAPPRPPGSPVRSPPDSRPCRGWRPCPQRSRRCDRQMGGGERRLTAIGEEVDDRQDDDRRSRDALQSA